MSSCRPAPAAGKHTRISYYQAWPYHLSSRAVSSAPTSLLLHIPTSLSLPCAAQPAQCPAAQPAQLFHLPSLCRIVVPLTTPLLPVTMKRGARGCVHREHLHCHLTRSSQLSPAHQMRSTKGIYRLTTIPRVSPHATWRECNSSCHVTSWRRA